MIVRIMLFLATLLAIAPAALAHEIRPAFLQIREIESDTYDILWKTPAQGDMRLALNVTLPPACANVGDPRTAIVDGAVIQTWRSVCLGGLVGQTLAIENLSQTLTDAIVRYESQGGVSRSFLLKPDRPFVAIPARQAWTDVGAAYFRPGSRAHPAWLRSPDVRPRPADPRRRHPASPRRRSQPSRLRTR